MAEPRLRLLEGVRETATDYRFPPLGLVVEKERPGAEEVLLAYGMAARVTPGWWLFASRPRLLPAGVGRAATAAAAVVARGTLPIVAIAALVTAVGGVFGSLSLIAVGAATAMLALSLIVHEMGHAVAFRAVDPRGCAIVAARGANASLTRRALSGRKETMVVAAGPCAPALVGVPLLPFAAWAWLPVAAWFAIALAHIVAVALPVGDGANLRAAVRHRRAGRRSDRTGHTGDQFTAVATPATSSSVCARPSAVDSDSPS